jgi:hypothetical protein
MATWSELTTLTPEVAAVGQALLERHGLAYLATIRADGSPRLHPVCPFVIDGRLIVATPRTSLKARDLLRDSRYAMHMLPGDDDAEFRIRGRVHAIGEGPGRDQIMRDGPHYLHDDDYIFAYDITEAASAHWVDVGQPGTYAVRQSWKEPCAPAEPLKIVWRFNLRNGIDPAVFFAWLRENVWSSSAAYGCVTRAFALKQAQHAYSTEATWPDAAARDRWQASDGFRAIPNYPGHNSPWAAQVDLEPVLYTEVAI